MHPAAGQPRIDACQLENRGGDGGILAPHVACGRIARDDHGQRGLGEECRAVVAHLRHAVDECAVGDRQEERGARIAGRGRREGRLQQTVDEFAGHGAVGEFAHAAALAENLQEFHDRIVFNVLSANRRAPRRGAGASKKTGTHRSTHRSESANPVSRVLFSGRAGASVIYLRRRSPAASSNLPPGIGRATLNCRYTRSCNPRDVRPDDIAASAVGSYPAFSPLPGGMHPAGRSFSVTLPYPYGHQVVSLHGALRCPDFPPPAEAGGDRADLPRQR